MREEVPKHWPWIVVGSIVGGVLFAVLLGLMVQLGLWLVG